MGNKAGEKKEFEAKKGRKGIWGKQVAGIWQVGKGEKLKKIQEIEGKFGVFVGFVGFFWDAEKMGSKILFPSFSWNRWGKNEIQAWLKEWTQFGRGGAAVLSPKKSKTARKIWEKKASLGFLFIRIFGRNPGKTRLGFLCRGWKIPSEIGIPEGKSSRSLNSPEGSKKKEKLNIRLWFPSFHPEIL